MEPIPKCIEFDIENNEYSRILAGAPETVTMRSGLVTLAPGENVGIHNTNSYEEILVVLSGEGKMHISGGQELVLKFGKIAYCPPETEHNVENTGTAPLKYIYIVAKAK